MEGTDGRYEETFWDRGRYECRAVGGVHQELGGTEGGGQEVGGCGFGRAGTGGEAGA